MHKYFIRVAHRGASGLAPENTLAAFAKAVAIGVDAVELDVHATRDGHVVAIHDSTLDRTTDATGKVSELTLAELRKADAGMWFGDEFAGQSIPTLAESLSLLKGQAVTVVEIKQQHIAREVVRTIEDAGAVDDVVVISFHPQTIRDVRAASPFIPTGLLVKADPGEDPYAQGVELAHRTAELGAGMLSLSHTAVTPGLARALRERGISLSTWTVDDVDRMRYLLDCGVGAITSNHPERFSELP